MNVFDKWMMVDGMLVPVEVFENESFYYMKTVKINSQEFIYFTSIDQICEKYA